MATTPRLLSAAGVAAFVAVCGTGAALACGSNGYTHSGLGARGVGYGMSAEITAMADYAVARGHVAAYVGVGGPAEGPGGSREWLQVGLSGFPGVTGDDVYYEVAKPYGQPVYHQLAAHVPAGKAVTVAVLELRNRPSRWRVWLDGRPVSRPILLPGSHGRWQPVASAEAWDGGTGGGVCNGFLYDFRQVRVAHAPGGHWRLLSSGYLIESAPTRMRRARGNFLAAEGLLALQLLQKLTP
jgi:hypothetical protein